MIKFFYINYVLVSLSLIMVFSFTKREDQIVNYNTLQKDGKHYLNLANKSLNINSDSTFFYAKEALKLGEKSNDSTVIGYSKYYVGKYYFTKRDYNKGFKYINESYTIGNYIKDTLLIIKSGINLINYSNVIGDFNKSQKIFNETIEIAKVYNNSEYILILNANMGILYGAIEEDDLAIHYYTKALEISLQQNNRRRTSALYNNIGTIFIGKGDYDTSMKYLSKALRIHQEDENWNKIAMVYTNFSDAYLKKQNYDSAFYYSEKVLDIARKEQIASGTLNANYCTLGEIYLRQNKVNLAKIYLDTSERRALKFKDIDTYPETLLLKSQWNEKFGDLKKALKLLRRHNHFKDSVIKSNRIINTLSKDYEISLENQKEKIFDLEKEYDKQIIENKSLSSLIWITAFIILGLVIAGYVYYNESKTKELAIQKEASENKLQALQSQMNPHFIFNSFNAIQHHILTSNKKKASAYLIKISQLIRRVLNNSSKMEVKFQDEIDLLKNYVELESMRYQGKFEYEFNISEELLIQNPIIPSMLIQPIVENAIIHGLANKHDGKGKLTVSGKIIDKSVILFTIIDNGIGRAKAEEIKLTKTSLMKHNSIAESNIKTRLSILKKIGYPNNKLIVEDLYDGNIPIGTKVLLEINEII